MNMTHPKVTGSTWEFQDCSEFRFVYEIAPEKVAKYKLYLEYFNFIIYYITSGTTFQS